MLTEAQVTEFDRHGYLNAGPVLSNDELRKMTEQLDDILDKGPDGFSANETRPVLFKNLLGDGADSAVWQIVNVWEASPAFEKLIYHPFIVKVVSQLTSFAELLLWHDQVQYKPPHSGGATGWHQDAPLWPIIRPMTPVSAWIPFDNADVDNGCMWMVPGSHKWGNQIEFLQTQKHLQTLDEFKNLDGFIPPPKAEIKTVQCEPRPVRRGEVHFHHSLAWHGSPINQSDRPRRAVALHYMTGEASFVASGNHVMKQFVNLEDGAAMTEAGEHFPVVCRHGKPLGIPPRYKR